ncbi:hypothetical protein Godav_023486 [Gossypium davidsonii]|uniref:MADS-box domain-containing protein n=1 Tax=Gossypium davidsonii TaxID=34287 RepID=A0A7J8SRX8_GOSDV|nr:hypothetical protein [Gossypium davidsonii]
MNSIKEELHSKPSERLVKHSLIYEKISKLSSLCGGEILFIIFLPTCKPYSFRDPSVESIAKRYLKPNQPLTETTYAPIEDYRKVRINLLV